jgi:hypothetical protein
MDKKISQLTSASLPLTGSEVFPLVQGGVTKKITIADAAAAIDTTYSSFVTAINNSTLIPGAIYRITDYKSVNFLNGSPTYFQNTQAVGPFDPVATYTSGVEVLLVQAASENTIFPIASSESFPDDVIYYSPLQSPLSAYFELYNGVTLPGGGTLSGFDLQWDSTNNYAYFDLYNDYAPTPGKEMYLYLSFGALGDIDATASFNPLNGSFELLQSGYLDVVPPITDEPITMNLENGNTRIIFPFIDLTTFSSYDVDSLYIYYYTSNFPVTTYGYITKRIDPLRNISIGADWKNMKYRRYEIDTSTLTNNGLQYIGTANVTFGITTTGNYEDLHVLPPYADATYGGVIIDVFDNVVFTSEYIYSVEIKSATFSTLRRAYRLYANYINNSYLSAENCNLNYISNSILGGINTIAYVNALFISFSFVAILYKSNIQVLTNCQFSDIRDSNLNYLYFVGTITSVIYNSNINGIDSTYGPCSVGSIYNSNIYASLSSVTIGANFNGNIIQSSQSSISLINGVNFGDNFRMNNVEYVADNTNFTSATHVKALYNCRLLRSSASTNLLEYNNGTALVYVSQTA